MINLSLRGCQTCRRRRVKCDANQTGQACNRCLKASRLCVWDPNDQAGLHFKNENAFAQGRRRRPKKLDADSQVTPSPVNSPRRSSLSTPIDGQALTYFAGYFVFCPDSLPDMGNEYTTFALPSWTQAQPGSSLHLALYALAHATFGRARRMPNALIDAESLYADSIVQIQKDMIDPGRGNIDHLLLTVMLMGFYENIMYSQAISSVVENREVGARFHKTHCHHEGAICLLNLKFQQGQSQNSPVSRAVRRQIIRTCLLRGQAVPQFLRDGGVHGEVGPALELDSLMVRTATLRAKSLTSILATGSTVHEGANSLNSLISLAEDLEAELSYWPMGLPRDWQSSPFTLEKDNPWPEDFCLENLVQSYTSHAHATAWNRYRATRLIVNSIRVRALTRLLHDPADSPLSIEQQCTDRIMDPIAQGICASVPFFFSKPYISDTPSPPSLQTAESSRVEPKILPKLAVFLAWPLTVAVSTPGVSARYQEWLKKKLKIVAASLGDSVLESVVDHNAFRF